MAATCVTVMAKVGYHPGIGCMTAGLIANQEGVVMKGTLTGTR